MCIYIYIYTVYVPVRRERLVLIASASNYDNDNISVLLIISSIILFFLVFETRGVFTGHNWCLLRRWTRRSSRDFERSDP